jgi:uncharacterized membrane-anchored protein YjiN (DUF445 family)
MPTTQIEALKRMRRIAGGLLLLMTVIFIASSLAFKMLNLPAYSVITYLRAFSEAAMVGAIADWFAVTALFRHPFGLPIPHTAIIPTKKDVIGESLGKFVENNFLTPEILTEKIQDLEISTRLEEWLSKPENSNLIAENIASIIPAILNTLDDDAVKRFIEDKVLNKITGDDVAHLGGNLLQVLIANKKHDVLFNELVNIVFRLFDENKELIRKQLKKEIPWILRTISVDKQIYEKIVDIVDDTFVGVNKDVNHPLRKHFNQSIENFINDLLHSDRFNGKIEELKNELLQNPLVSQYFDGMWQDLKQYLLDALSQQNSSIREQLQKSVYNICMNLVNDEALRQRISTWVLDSILTLATKYRHEIGSIIAGTIQKWDKETLSSKLELQVGKDLQYIRISGTLVGGTIGFFLHLFSHIIHLF